MKKEPRRQLKIYVEEYLREAIDKICENKKISMGVLVKNMILKQIIIEHSETLSKQEKEYITIKEKERMNNVLKYVRSKNAEKIFFLRNIKKQIYLFTLNRKDIDKKDLIHNMKLNLEIAKHNDWKNETKHIKEFLQRIKEYGEVVPIEHLPEVRKIDDTKKEEKYDGMPQ